MRRTSLQFIIGTAIAFIVTTLVATAQPRPAPASARNAALDKPPPLAPHHASTIKLDWEPAAGWTVRNAAIPAPNDENSLAALKLMNEARAQEEKGVVASPMKKYETIFKKYPNTLYASEALYRAARLRQQRHQYTKAFNHYQNLFQRYPGTPHFDALIQQQYNIADDLIEGKRPRYWGWLPGFKAKDEGLRLMGIVIRNAPYHALAPRALLTIAHGYKKQGDTDDAIDALDHLINSYADSPHSSDAYLTIAHAYGELVQGPQYDQAATLQSATYYEDYLILYPNASRLAEAEKGRDDMKTILAQNKLNAGDFYYLKRENLRAARVLYNEAITTFPQSPIAALARKRLEDVAKTEEQRRSRAENRIAIGDYFYKRAEYPAAIIFYKEAAAIKPDNETIQKAKDRQALAQKAKAENLPPEIQENEPSAPPSPNTHSSRFRPLKEVSRTASVDKAESVVPPPAPAKPSPEKPARNPNNYPAFM